MKLYSLEAVQELRLSLEDAWSFFSNPTNLAAITPPTLGFRIVSAVPPRMHEGLMIEYRVTPLLGLPVPWVTEITHVREPHYFVDEQRAGPYKLWHHEHIFEVIPGGVRMIDRVRYMLFLDPMSRLMHALLVRPKLEFIFEYRRKVLEQRFGGPLC